MRREQLSLLPAATGRPEGLVYRADLLTHAEEENLVARCSDLPFKPFEFQGFLGKRETVSFGWSYRFDGTGLAPAAPIPDWLMPVRAHAAALAGIEPRALEQALLIRYGEGAGLGWHRDRPVFGEVIGVSLLAPAPLRFRRRRGSKWERFTLTAEPRSAYLLRGAARAEWEHSIPPVEMLRFSITLRTIKSVPRIPGRGTIHSEVE
jgi:DNA oxidative demethylase